LADTHTQKIGALGFPRQYDHLFYGNKGYFLINLREQGISQTTNKKFDRKYKEEQNFFIGKMGEKAEFLTDQENMYPTWEVFKRCQFLVQTKHIMACVTNTNV